jgi:hypothetical protein
MSTHYPDKSTQPPMCWVGLTCLFAALGTDGITTVAVVGIIALVAIVSIVYGRRVMMGSNRESMELEINEKAGRSSFARRPKERGREDSFIGEARRERAKRPFDEHACP